MKEDEILYYNPAYKPSGKLAGKKALITGGDSGIGRAVAYAYAKEGADVAIIYFNEHEDAAETIAFIEECGRKALAFQADIRDPEVCRMAVETIMRTFGALDIIVNNAGTQTQQKDFAAITPTQLEETFKTNIFGMFYIAQAALPYLRAGSCIINTSSVTAYRGSEELIDYSSTKGAITSFTRSLALKLAGQNIRVNGVAPGPVWTPLIFSSFDEKKIKQFGSSQPLGRAAQPYELAPAYVYLGSDDSSYVAGQMLHVNGGEIINT